MVNNVGLSVARAALRQAKGNLDKKQRELDAARKSLDEQNHEEAQTSNAQTSTNSGEEDLYNLQAGEVERHTANVMALEAAAEEYRLAKQELFVKRSRAHSYVPAVCAYKDFSSISYFGMDTELPTDDTCNTDRAKWQMHGYVVCPTEEGKCTAWCPYDNSNVDTSSFAGQLPCIPTPLRCVPTEAEYWDHHTLRLPAHEPTCHVKLPKGWIHCPEQPEETDGAHGKCTYHCPYEGGVRRQQEVPTEECVYKASWVVKWHEGIPGLFSMKIHVLKRLL